MNKLIFILPIIIFLIYNQFNKYYDHQLIQISSLTSSNLIDIQRNKKTGIMEIYGDSSNDVIRGLGYVHAYDRLVQIELTRLAANGELSQYLKNNEQMIKTDIFFHEMGFKRISNNNINILSPFAKKYIESYISGINQYINEMKIKPLEFYFINYQPKPWTIEDVLAIGGLLSFYGFSSRQMEIEKSIIQSLKSSNTNYHILKEIFSPYMNDFDLFNNDNGNNDILNLIKNLNIEPWIDEDFLFDETLSGAGASNNWVLSAKQSSTGGVIMAADPHVPVNRLPSFWMEYIGYIRNNDDNDNKNELNYQYGSTIPGIPGFCIGRTNDITYSITYGSMDQIDYFFEEIRDGKYRNINNEWLPLNIINEKIYKKGEDEPINMILYSTPNGIIERSHDKIEKPIEDGLYLSRAWVGNYNVFHKMIEGTSRALEAKNVNEVRNALKDFPVSFNILMGDKDGNIGYQMTGASPIRGDNVYGILPLPGWDERYTWKGLLNPDKLATWQGNDGFLVTANADYNNKEFPHPVNLHLGFDRHNSATNTITNLSIEDRTLDSMGKLQCSTFSNHAETWFNLIKKHLNQVNDNDSNINEKNELRNKLLSWNYNFDDNSKEATLWIELYDMVKDTIIIRTKLMDEKTWESFNVPPLSSLYVNYIDNYILKIIDLHPNEFNKILNEEWEKIENKYINEYNNNKNIKNIWDLIPSWGEKNSFSMNNIFFGGKLPSFLGYDVDNMKLKGHRTSLWQGNNFFYRNKNTIAGPSYRFVTDMSTNQIKSIMAGGQSGRRFSNYYNNEVNEWDICQFKDIYLNK